MAEKPAPAPKRKYLNVSALAPENQAKSPPPPEPVQNDLDALIAERERIDSLLPMRSLKDIDIEKELVIQFLVVQRLQTRTMQDADTPPNQAAQVANSLASSLSALAKLQSEVYSSERIKRLEVMLCEILRTLPNEAQEDFFKLYENIAGQAEN